MIFNSFTFLFFFIATYLGYFLIPGRWRWLLLLISSYIFYLWWEPRYIVLIILSTLIDYFVAIKIQNAKIQIRKRQLLFISICSNLGLLAGFKYFNFFIESVNSGLGLMDFGSLELKSTLLLPVGISFYTFQTMSYTIDVYRGHLAAERHIGRFALYVSFFPQLVAGPIERASNLIPQFYDRIKDRISSQRFISGFSQATWGFFKKVVVADSLAIYVDSVYNNYQFHSGWTLLVATYLFAFQIYCDFSGYSDIAIGVARMLGFTFMDNFNLPYFSKSVTEFWQRWHISLSTWLRDYLYIPLGGNRYGNWNTYKNLLITMLLGGLWHGASWNFVIWGALNGIFLALERISGISLKPSNWVRKIIGSFLTFNLICLTWIFFRSGTFSQAISIIQSIVPLGPITQLGIQDVGVFFTCIFGISVLLFVEWIFLRKRSIEVISDELGLKMVFVNSIIILLIILFGVSEGSQFIYFQF